MSKTVEKWVKNCRLLTIDALKQNLSFLTKPAICRLSKIKFKKILFWHHPYSHGCWKISALEIQFELLRFFRMKIEWNFFSEQCQNSLGRLNNVKKSLWEKDLFNYNCCANGFLFEEETLILSHFLCSNFKSISFEAGHSK